MPTEKGHHFTNSVFNCNILQKEIVATEDGYHDPVQGDQVHGNFKQKHNWFEDDDFNNASDDADLFQTEITVDDENINFDAMSDTTSFVSNPTRSAKPKLAFDDVDKHAKQVMRLNCSTVQYIKQLFLADKLLFILKKSSNVIKHKLFS
jgi:hypothetical protein